MYDGSIIYLHNCNIIVRITDKECLNLTLVIGDKEISSYFFISDSYNIYNKILIGSSNSCNVVISNANGISKIQSTIFSSNGTWYINDGDSFKPSKNGTFLFQDEDKIEITSKVDGIKEVRYRKTIFKLSKFFI